MLRLGWRWQRGGAGRAPAPHCLPCPCAEPKCPRSRSPQGALHVAVPLPCLFTSPFTAASPTPTHTPKLLSWAAESSSQKLGDVLIHLLFSAAVNYILTCLFVPASFSVDGDGPSLISNYSGVCFLLLLKCVAPCPARCALSNLSSKRN